MDMELEEAFINFVLSSRPLPTVTTAPTLAFRMGEGSHDGRDRIGDLPDDLLRQVVSRLPIRDAVRTTTLSKRWRKIWHSAPLVLFDQHISAATEAQHVAAISSVLASHPDGPDPRIRTAHLAAVNFSDYKPELAQWARILAERGVEDLVLITMPLFGTQIKLDLPADILRCKKLHRLYLGFWAFPEITNLPGGVDNFPNLEELAILGTHSHTKNNDLDYLLASCPALKKLALAMNYDRSIPERVHLRSKELECAIFFTSRVDEIAVVEAKCLKRLIMWDILPTQGIRIAGDAPALKALGYLDTGDHQLQFGRDTIIQVQAGTNASPTCRVPSVKILAIRVDFGVFKDVQMLPSFLRCFPNTEILHVESAVPYKEPSENEKCTTKFFKALDPIECVRFHITKVFLYNFQGGQSEMEFLKYLVLIANQMQQLTLVLPYEEFDSEAENKIKVLLGDLLLEPEWASEACNVLLLRPVADHACSFHRAFDLSIEDPFLVDDGEELLSYMKRREQDVN